MQSTTCTNLGIDSGLYALIGDARGTEGGGGDGGWKRTWNSESYTEGTPNEVNVQGT